MKIYHVAFASEQCVEGFITDDPRDADWTATGKPKSSVVPMIGDGIRELLDNPGQKLPRKWALVFDAEQEAHTALAALTEKETPDE